MTRTAQYEAVLNELAAGNLDQLQQRVLDVLRRAYPHGLSREQLIQQIYGYSVDDLPGSTEDRRIRKAIEAMRLAGIPIVSTSGEPGYRLDVSDAAFAAMDAELASRENHLRDRRNAIQQTRQKIRAMGVSAIPQDAPRKATQIGFDWRD